MCIFICKTLFPFSSLPFSLVANHVRRHEREKALEWWSLDGGAWLGDEFILHAISSS